MNIYVSLQFLLDQSDLPGGGLRKPLQLAGLSGMPERGQGLSLSTGAGRVILSFFPGRLPLFSLQLPGKKGIITNIIRKITQWNKTFSKFFKDLFLFYVHDCFACVHVCVPCVCSAYRGQRRSSGTGVTDGYQSPEGSGNCTQVLCKSALTIEPSL